VAQGERQVEALIEQGRADQAALALKILLQLDPKNRNRRAYQRRLRGLGG
jgi:cytochrome c-type biogenesis protein CcmH/NrfG